MRIITERGEYDLPSGFVLEIDRNNPFFSNISEKSIPVTLPWTKNNRRIVGFDPIILTNKPISRINVKIEDGAYQYHARQVIHSISEEGISTTFYFHLSKLWEQINDISLREILSEYSYPVGDLIDNIKPYIDCDNCDFAIFPVALEMSNIMDTHFIGNQQNNYTSLPYPSLIGLSPRMIGHGEKQISVPAGYGITIFLKSRSLLRMVMSYFGYSITNNLLTTGELRNIVWLNPVMDAVVRDIISYDQLVPDITIQEFLEVYRSMFDCEFVPDDITSTVDILFFQEQVDKSPSHDLSKYALRKRKLSVIDKFSQVKISVQRNLSGSECELDTFEKFQAKYNSIGAISEEDWGVSSFRLKYDCVYRLAEGRFYSVIPSGDNSSFVEPISSGYFNYDKGGELTHKEFSQKHQAVPIIRTTWGLMPYIGPAIHLNTHIQDSEKVENTKFDIMLCFAKFYTQQDKHIAYGSINNYDYRGVRDSNYSLQTWGADGLFHRFFSKRDAIIRHSNMSLTIDMIIPEHLKASLKEHRPVRIGSQELLIEKIGYTLGKNSIKECMFRTMRLYKDFNIATEQSIPLMVFDHGVPIYCWIHQSNSGEIIERYADQANEIELIWVDLFPLSPPNSPTETQYEESQAGAIFFEKWCRVKVLEYYQGYPQREYSEEVHCWYIVGRR